MLIGISAGIGGFAIVAAVIVWIVMGRNDGGDNSVAVNSNPVPSTTQGSDSSPTPVSHAASTTPSADPSAQEAQAGTSTSPMRSPPMKPPPNSRPNPSAATPSTPPAQQFNTPGTSPTGNNGLSQEVIDAWGAGSGIGGRPSSTNPNGVPIFMKDSLTDEMLSQLPKPTTPFGLQLLGSELTDTGLTELGTCTQLEWLWIVGSDRYTDAGALALAQLTELRLLVLSSNALTDRGLEVLQQLPHLRYLNVANARVTEAGMAHVASLTELRHLLAPSSITDRGLQMLSELPNLEVLECYAATQITDNGLRHLAEMESLKELTLKYTNVTDAGLRHLAGLTQLTSLDLTDTRITDNGLQHLVELKNLTELHLPFTLSETAIQELKRALPQCEIQNF